MENTITSYRAAAQALYIAYFNRPIKHEGLAMESAPEHDSTANAPCLINLQVVDTTTSKHMPMLSDAIASDETDSFDLRAETTADIQHTPGHCDQQRVRLNDLAPLSIGGITGFTLSHGTPFYTESHTVFIH